MLKWLKESIVEGSKIIGEAIEENNKRKDEEKRQKAAKYGFVTKGKCHRCGKENVWIKKNTYIEGLENENICYDCVRKLAISAGR